MRPHLQIQSLVSFSVMVNKVKMVNVVEMVKKDKAQEKCMVKRSVMNWGVVKRSVAEREQDKT